MTTRIRDDAARVARCKDRADTSPTETVQGGVTVTIPARAEGNDIRLNRHMKRSVLGAMRRAKRQAKRARARVGMGKRLG